MHYRQGFSRRHMLAVTATAGGIAAGGFGGRFDVVSGAAAQAQAAEQVNRFRSSYASKLQFDYPLDSKAGRDPFLVSAIYHDDSFTYIKCAAREKPALYEIKDRKPNLISFQFENGIYIAPKIIDTGYLAVGKKKLNFSRRAVGN